MSEHIFHRCEKYFQAHIYLTSSYFQRRTLEAFIIEMEKWICVIGWVKSACVICLQTPGARHTKQVGG